MEIIILVNCSLAYCLISPLDYAMIILRSGFLLRRKYKYFKFNDKFMIICYIVCRNNFFLLVLCDLFLGRNNLLLELKIQSMI